MTISLVRTRTLLLTLVPAALLILAGTALGSMRRNASAAPEPAPLLEQLNLARENVVAVWFSSMLPLLASAACLFCFLATADADRRGRMRAGWIVLAIGFALMSLDEMASIHERLAEERQLLAWAVAGWPLFLVIPGFVAAFAWFQLRRNRAAFRLLILGILCLSSVPLQEYLEAPYYTGDPNWVRPTIPLLLEEGGELLGLLLCLLGCWVYARSLVAGGSSALTASEGLRPAVAAICATLLGLLGVLLLLDLPTSRNLGAAANWFPSALAALAAILALCGEAGRVRGLTAGSAVALSVFVGGNIYWELGLGRWPATLGAAAMSTILIAWLLTEWSFIPRSE